MCGLLWEYFITPFGLEIRVCGYLPIYRLKNRNIIGAYLVEGIDELAFGGHPWNTLRIGNRLRWRWVLVEKRWWPRFLAITPKNPDDFVKHINQLGHFTHQFLGHWPLKIRQDRAN